MASSHPPAYRPYRVAVYVAFIAIAAFGTLLFLGSIVRHVKAPAAATERQVATPGQPLTPGEYGTCYRALAALHRRLDDRFYSLGALASRKGAEGAAVWQDFARSWEADLDRTGRECGIGEGQAGDPRAARLESLYESLVDLQRIYSEHATRLLTDDGDTIRAAQEAFEQGAPGS